MKKSKSNHITEPAESLPKAGPKLHLHEKPKLHSSENKLVVTPEKPKVIKHVGTKPKPVAVRKKVAFKENDEKLANDLSDMTLSKPTINSTNALKKEIGKARKKKFDVPEDILKEVSRNFPDDAANTGINFKLSDKKYKNLTSVDVPNDDAIPKPKPKSLFKPRKKDEECKPHLMDLYNVEYFGNESYSLDDQFPFELENCTDEEEEEEKLEDKYAFLFDMYNYNAWSSCSKRTDDGDGVGDSP